MEYVELGVRCLIGVVFAVSALSKLSGRSAMNAFTGFVRQLDVVPAPWIRPAAGAVVALEALVALLLVLPGPWGLALAVGLLAGFTGAILAALRRGVCAPCRCFGRSTAPLGGRQVARNLFLVVAASVGLLEAASGPATPVAMHPGGVAVAAAGGLLAAVAVTMLDDVLDLFDLFAPPRAGRP